MPQQIELPDTGDNVSVTWAVEQTVEGHRFGTVTVIDQDVAALGEGAGVRVLGDAAQFSEREARMVADEYGVDLTVTEGLTREAGTSAPEG